jgi:hypothetical protein
MPRARRRIVEALCLLAAAAVFAGVTLPPGALIGDTSGPNTVGPNVLPLDDAYIFVRFAQQVSRGHGLEWTEGQPSTGATSLSYLLLLLPGQWWADGLAGWGRWSQWIGLLTLWLLGLASLSLFRALRLAEPWPLLGALAVTLSGTVGWGALAGMESAWNAAAVLFACGWAIRLLAEGESRSGRTPFVLFAGSAAVLPLFRPENSVLAVAAFVLLLLHPAGRGRRPWVPLVLVPALALVLANLAMTGETKPAGAIVKAITEYPFLDLGTLWSVYALNLGTRLLPAYLGTAGNVLPAPVGWLVLAVGLIVPVVVVSPRFRAGRSLPALAVPVATWWVLFLLAPLSSMLHWQYMRHHHAALTLSWVIAWAVVALGAERLIRHLSWPAASRWAGALVPLLLLVASVSWSGAYADGQADISRRHGPAGEWLAGQRQKQVLLVNDAGYLQLRHDGPAIDIMGLGTPALGRPHRHGAGASAEALARQPRLPTVAAVNRDVFLLEDLLGEPILPLPEIQTDTVLAEVRLERLERTVLRGPGIDFSHLDDERRHSVGWTIEPSALAPSVAVLWNRGAQGETLHGCRPVPERILWDVPDGVARSRALVFAPPGQGVELVIHGYGDLVLARTLIAAGDAKVIEFDTAGARVASLERASGGVPCIESVSFD